MDGSISATGTIIFNNLELTIGVLKFETTDFFLDGNVDEVTVWSKALSEMEVNDHMCISGDPASIPDLVGYYDFNEETGLILPDYFGNYDGYLTNMSGNEWIPSEVCGSGYDITFIVTEVDGTTPVEGASVDLEGNVKFTDENGEAVFSNYEPGIFAYEVTKDSYYQYDGEVEVIDENVIVNIQRAQVIYYDFTFIITEDPGGIPIDSALVNLNGFLQYTNENGETTFSGYLPGTYSYFISKEGYYFESGDVEVIDDDVILEISLLIDDISNLFLNEFNIYPNPTNGIINFSFEKLPDKIEIVNLMGDCLNVFSVKQNYLKIDISEYPEGFYFVNFVDENIIYSQKLLKISH